jgi:Spy/CpxP family protein refolding chaperone
MKLLVIATAAFAATMFAQGPGGPGRQAGPPPTDKIKAYLGLTDAQIQQLQALQQQKATTLQSTFQEIAQKQNSLQQQLASGSANAAALGTLLLDVENLRKKISQTDSTFQAQAVKLLDSAQTAKLKALQDAANLAPTIGQAGALQLLVPPENQPGGPGFGPRGFGGPVPGMGPGPMPMRHRGPMGMGPRQ